MRAGRPVFSFRPNLEDPDHKKAWEMLGSVPEGQKNQFLVKAILKRQETKELEEMIRKTVREELRRASPEGRREAPGSGSVREMTDGIPDEMLAFLSQMENG